MKIIPAYISSNVNVNKSKMAFTSNSVNQQSNTTVNNLADVNKDYSVRIPIAYKHIEDIKLNDELTAKCYKLANGQQVILVPKKGVTVVKTYVNTGSFNEPDNLRGISHYIEHNLFNGSDELGEKVFFDEVNKMGANTNASTSFANTNYYISSNLLEDTDLENKIQLHAGMLQTPKFLLDKLEKEKKIVNSEINMCLSDNENIGYSQTVKNLFNIKSSSIDLVAGNTDNITALTRDDVIKYFNNNYYPGNMTTVITGEINPEETIKLVSKYFNSTKAPQGTRLFEKMTPINNPIRQDIISPKSKSGISKIFLGFAGPENNNTTDAIYLNALSILAGDLNNSRSSEVERKYGIGITYMTDRLSSRAKDKTLILVETDVPESKAEFALHEIYDIVNKLSKEPPTEEELIAIKNKMKKSYDRILESSHMLNETIGEAYLNDNIKGLKEYNTIIDNMTTENILATAKKYLDLNRVAVTVVHPNGTTDEQIQNNYITASNSRSLSNIPFTGINKKVPINTENINSYRANNNFEIILNNATTNTVQYKLSLSETEWTPKKAAVADILSDIFENAGTMTKSIEDISKIADKLAISSGLYADHYGISMSANFPLDSTKEALDLFNDKIKNPNFNKKDFDAAVNRLKDIYKNHEVNPYDKFYAYIYEGTPLAYTPEEMLESLNHITLNDVISYYNEIFTKGQGKIVVTGPFNKNPELKNQIFEFINTYPSVKQWDNSLEKIYKPIEKTKIFTDINLKNQADIIQGYRFKQNGNLKDDNCIALLNIILGGSSSSRLFSDLREARHLAYSVSSKYNNLGDMGVFYLKIGTTTQNQETGEKTFDNIQKSIQGFNDNIKLISTEKVSEEELEMAKKQLKSELYSILESNSGKNQLISASKNTPYNIDYINKRFEEIDTITADDILNTAKYIFNSKPIYSITATKETMDYNKNYLENLAK